MYVSVYACSFNYIHLIAKKILSPTQANVIYVFNEISLFSTSFLLPLSFCKSNKSTKALSGCQKKIKSQARQYNIHI